MTPYERETVINFNMEDDRATIYTCQTGLINKLDKKCELYPKHYKLIQQDESSKTYELDKKLLCFRSPKILTEDQKEILSERFKKMRAEKVVNI